MEDTMMNKILNATAALLLVSAMMMAIAKQSAESTVTDALTPRETVLEQLDAIDAILINTSWRE